MNSTEEQVKRAIIMSGNNPDQQVVDRVVERVKNENVDLFDALIEEGISLPGVEGNYVSDNNEVGVNGSSVKPLSSTTRTIADLPVINENGEYLAFLNPKGGDTIHIAKVEEPDDDPAAKPGMTGRAPKVYRWSVCGMGSSRGKNKNNAIYLNEEDLDGDYVTRSGDVVGKICGNCRKSL